MYGAARFFLDAGLPFKLPVALIPCRTGAAVHHTPQAKHPEAAPQLDLRTVGHLQLFALVMGTVNGSAQFAPRRTAYVLRAGRALDRRAFSYNAQRPVGGCYESPHVRLNGVVIIHSVRHFFAEPGP